MEHVAGIIIEYAFLPVLITATYTLAIFRRLVNEMKHIGYFILFSAVIEIVSKILWYQKENNLPLLHLYVLIGFLLLIWFYHHVLKEYLQRNVLLSIACCFSIFTVINSIAFETIYTFNSTALSIQAILLIIISIFTFIVLMNDIVKENRSGLHKSLNWINSGIFVYYLSSLMVFYFGNVFIQYYSPLTNQYLWCMHSLFLMVMYSCFFIGLWKSPKA